MSGLKPRRAAVLLPGLAACVALLAMGGCTSIGGVKFQCAEQAAGPDTVNAWWYASFRVNWPQDQEDPALDTDLLIAHRIVSPVLDRYRKDIVLWRFHRRALRDDAGHQFGFIFYTTAPNARKIYAAIDSSAVLSQLKAVGVIQQVILDDTNTIARPGIEATSDPHWSPPLQKAWPFFIMGVSQTWLDLISQYAEDGRRKPDSIAEMQAFYREMSQEVESTWKKEGGHAFLHHLNALFGYGPVNLRGKIEMSF
jgi:hypothetical protein